MKKVISHCIVVCMSILTANAANGPLYLNEILFNPDGPDSPNNYIEIVGPPNSVIPPGTYLIEIESDSGATTGEVQDFIDLSGLTLGANGFLVLLQSGNVFSIFPQANTSVSLDDIENSSLTVMLAQSPIPPEIGLDIDGDDDGVPDGVFFFGLTINDSVGALDGGTADIGYGEINFTNQGNGIVITGVAQAVPFDPGYVGRRGATGGSSPSDWVASKDPLAVVVPFRTILNFGAVGDFRLQGTGNVFPDTVAEKPLNHIGGTNGNFAPSAVFASIRGRVRTADGNGLNRVTVMITGNVLPEPIYRRTNHFGYFTFDDLPVGEQYVLQVISPKHIFNQSSRIINLVESISDADFVGVSR